MRCISIHCFFDFIAFINLVLMHHDNMRFGLLYYYCLLLRKTSPNYMTDSRCPHLLNRYQCVTYLLGPEMINYSRWMYLSNGNRDSTMMSYRCDMAFRATGFTGFYICMPVISRLQENAATTLTCLIKERIGIHCLNFISFTK